MKTMCCGIQFYFMAFSQTQGFPTVWNVRYRRLVARKFLPSIVGCPLTMTNVRLEGPNRDDIGQVIDDHVFANDLSLQRAIMEILGSMYNAEVTCQLVYYFVRDCKTISVEAHVKLWSWYSTGVKIVFNFVVVRYKSRVCSGYMGVSDADSWWQEGHENGVFVLSHTSFLDFLFTCFQLWCFETPWTRRTWTVTKLKPFCTLFREMACLAIKCKVAFFFECKYYLSLWRIYEEKRSMNSIFIRTIPIHGHIWALRSELNLFGK